MRTYGVNQAFRFDEGIRLHRKSRPIRDLFRKRTILHHTCTIFSELPAYISTVGIWDIFSMDKIYWTKENVIRGIATINRFSMM